MENGQKVSGVSIREIRDEGWRDEGHKTRNLTFMIKETVKNCTCSTNPVTSSDLVKIYGKTEVISMLGRYACELAKEASTPGHSLHEFAKKQLLSIRAFMDEKRFKLSDVFDSAMSQGDFPILQECQLYGPVLKELLRKPQTPNPKPQTPS